MASKKDGVLYIGVTSDLIRRVYEHRNHLVKGFTDKYLVTKLVYFEPQPNSLTAFKREGRLKKWNREWKINLIQKTNPEWIDLYSTIV